MLEISKYIQDLLYLHDCVIIPGFGGFVANYKAAQIDRRNNQIHPPSKDIGFNCNLNRNDGLLIKYLADAENLEYAEAEKSVNFFVEDIRVQLQRGETVYLKNIGSFYNDRKFNLQFTPNNRINYLIASLGLDSLELTSVSSRPEQTITTLATQSQPIARSISVKRWGYMSAAAACLFAVALLPTSSENNTTINAAAIGIENSFIPTTKKAPVISNETELVAFKPKLNKKVKVSIKARPMYYLIAGCFSSAENAEHLQNKLVAKSYPATVFAFKNLQAVAVNRFETKEEAIKLKQNFQEAFPYISCWILKK